MTNRTYFKSVLILIAFVFSFTSNKAFAQEKQYKVACIGFYNLENLYDTLNDPNKNDEEFTPEGSNKWSGKRYNQKLINLSEVISQIGNEYVKGGPAIMGFSEVENIHVVEDLINTPLLKPLNYGIVHFDSPDRRGVDVALIYKKSLFTVTNSVAVPLHTADTSFRTRDELVVSGLLDGEKLHIIVNHWPSRSGGEKRSAPKRIAAAELCRSIVDSLTKEDPNAKIVIMGDLNDDPTNKSVSEFLKAKGEKELVTATGDLYNPMYKLFKKDGIGSLAYRDKWNLFDQIIVSYPLLGDASKSYKFFKAHVFNKPFLGQKEGAFRGYPWRTYAGGVYLGGYSDHFPTYIFLVKESK